MNDQSAPTTEQPPADDGFDANRVRTIADMKRSTDSRVIAGVSAGAARYLNIDPVILRILFVVLTFVGLAGPILYLAAWFLIPEDGAEKSIAADWFSLDRNEPQVRVVGLVAAAILAVAAVIGDSAWDTGWIIWLAIPVAFLYWLFSVRPRRKREAMVAEYEQTGVAPPDLLIQQYTSAKVAEALAKRDAHPRSKALVGLTLSAAIVGVAITWLVDLSGTHIEWAGYVAVALGIIAVGLLVGTVIGNATALIFIGIPLAIALTVSCLPLEGGIGRQVHEPTAATGLESEYTHGIGELVIDLRDVDPADLNGETINVETGIGHTIVWVPDGAEVFIDAHLDTGELEIFGEVENGRANEIHYRSDNDVEDPFVINIDQKVGNVEVVSE